MKKFQNRFLAISVDPLMVAENFHQAGILSHSNLYAVIGFRKDFSYDKLRNLLFNLIIQDVQESANYDQFVTHLRNTESLLPLYADTMKIAGMKLTFYLRDASNWVIIVCYNDHDK